jgi:putative flippase GtrA
MNISRLRCILSDSQVIGRFLRFSAIGAGTTLGYFALTNVAVTLCGSGPKSASIGVYLLLMPISFMGHRHLTFASSGQTFLEGIRFCSIHAINLIVAFGISLIAVDRSGLPPWTAFLIISAAVPVVNFIAFQTWVFSNKDTRTRHDVT